MRKRRLAILVAFCIAFLTLFMQTYAASSAPTKSEIYTAYYDFLRQRIDDVGILEPSTVTGSEFAIPERSGVYYAQLLDFDQDGTDELFVIESKQGESISAGYDVLETWNLCWSIYSYSGNSIQFLGEGEFLGSGRAPFGFCTALDGTQYFFFSNFLDSYSGEYYTVINGNLEKKYSLYVAFNYDWSVSGTVNGEDVWVHSDTMHSSLYQVNNEWVDYSTFMEKRNQLRANNVIEYGFLNNRVPDGATQQVINQLTQQIPESYLSGYYSPSSWAKSGVIQAIGKGFVPNNLQRKYNQPITRAEFCALAVKYYETTAQTNITQTVQFNDTMDINVQKLAGLGVVGGVGNGNFNPNGFLTRESAAVILVRLAEVLGCNVNEIMPAFSDNADISDWAILQVGAVQTLGIMSGVENNQFSPQSLYTREQSILTISRLEEIQPSIESLKLKESRLEILVGMSKTLTPVIESSTAGNKTLSWSSSNESVASVNPSTGDVLGISAGTATITATATNGVSASCIITVTQPQGRLYADLPVTVALPVLDVYGRETGEVAATITITDIVPTSVSTNNQYQVYGTLSTDGKKSLYGSKISWEILDYDGNVVESGTEKLYFLELGENIDFYVYLPWSSSGNESYIIRFPTIIS